MSDRIEEAARRLREAQETGRACAPVRDLIKPDDVTAAYAVQSINVEHALALGRTAVGRKIGLTSPAVQRQLGVAQPDFGTLFADMQVPNGRPAPWRGLLQPRAEAEVVFWIAADLTGPGLTLGEVKDAVGGVSAGLEIVDSRIGGWDISIADTVADNASSGLFVVGDEIMPLDEVMPAEVEMTMAVNERIVSSGSGAACLGDPLLALLWLARTCVELGRPLRRGELVLSGALGPMADVRPGDRVRAHVSGLGTVETAFGGEDG